MKEIEIPEGYKARIEGNKVIIGPKISEDKEIRKEILDYFKDKKEKLDYLCFELGDVKNAPFSEAKQVDDFIAYLERQEESWVPTDEQRHALGMVIKHSNPDADSTKVLESLLDDLTKIANSKVAKWKENQKEQKPAQFKGGSLAEIIKGEFEGFRSLLKKKGIDYEPQSTYWESFARLFDSSAREYLKEQKPVNWTELNGEDIAKLEVLINIVHNEYPNGIGQESFGEEVLERFREYKEDEDLDEKEQKPITKFKVGDKVHFKGDDVNILTITGLREDAYCTDSAYGPILFSDQDEWEIVEQKPAEWSEEEYGRLFDIEHYLSGTLQLSPDRKIACIDFLKSLRPQSQRKDTYYDIIHNILASLKDVDFMQITPEHRVSLLNDIRVKCKNADECAAILDEPHWKPSKEQIEALKYFIRSWGESGIMSPQDTTLCAANSLLIDLQKLLKQ